VERPPTEEPVGCCSVAGVCLPITKSVVMVGEKKEEVTHQTTSDHQTVKHLHRNPKWDASYYPESSETLFNNNI